MPQLTQCLRIVRRHARRLVLVGGLVALPFVAWAASIYTPVLLALRLAPVTVVDAQRVGSELDLSYHWPQTQAGPLLVRVGAAPTPASVCHHLASQRHVIACVYENLGSLTLLAVERATGRVVEHPLPESQLVYGSLVDRRDEQVVWIAASLRPTLYRLDTQAMTSRAVFTPPGETHLFALDQHVDGSLFVGTCPGHRCYHVRDDDRGTHVDEIVVREPSIAHCSYLLRVFATARHLFLYYSAPATVLRYDLATGETEIVARSPQAFLDFDVANDVLSIRDGARQWHYNRQGTACAAPSFDQRGSNPGYLLTTQRGNACIDVDGRQVSVSLAPRSGGMSISALVAGADGRVYGGTYWNTWMFAIDPATNAVRGLGALPEGSGEFFTAAPFGERLAVPSYQGLLYFFDPQQPWESSPAHPNPRLAARVPGVHYATACTIDGRGRLVYGTFPNYGQPGGALVFADAAGHTHVVPRIGDDATIGCLATVGGQVYGGTTTARGLGTVDASASPQRPRLLAFSPEGNVERTWELSDRGDEVRGLLAVSDHELLCATRKRLFWVDVSDSPPRAQEVSRAWQYKQVFHASIARLVRYDETRALVLTEKLLLAFDLAARELRVVCRLPATFEHLAVDGQGNAWLAGPVGLHVLPADALR